MRILVVHRKNFGYHVGTYFLCKYASRNHDVTFVGLEEKRAGRKHAYLPNVNFVELTDRGSKITRQIRFLRDVSRTIRSGNYDVVFLNFFRGCSILRCLHPHTRFIFDIRTGSINTNRLKRWLLDRWMMTEARFFKNRSVISEGLRDRLGLSRQTPILPLGADTIVRAKAKPVDSKCRLLYIGTLNGRHLEDTIRGLRRFLETTKFDKSIEYDIIGDGCQEDWNKLEMAIKECNLTDCVKLHGYIPRDLTAEFLSKADIGISYVPISSFYDIQPVTKTYEYLLAGLPVLATETKENKKILNKNNGVLILDTPESFANGLERIVELFPNYCFETIQKSAASHTWENIIETHYLPYMLKLCEQDMADRDDILKAA